MALFTVDRAFNLIAYETQIIDFWSDPDESHKEFNW